LYKSEPDADQLVSEQIFLKDWALLRYDIETTVKKNTGYFDELKTREMNEGVWVSPEYEQSHANLELKNENIKARLADYDKSQENWDLFDRQLNLDLDEFEEALKVLSATP
jgi:hypothetical protein